MFRIIFMLLSLAIGGCVLDRGEDRRPEILPGSYRSIQGNVQVDYDFQSDGSFASKRTVSGKTTLTESGLWEYQYDGPDERYLIEREVARRDLGSDSAWHDSLNLDFKYRIKASSPQEFHLDPGSGGGHLGGLILLFLFIGSDDAVFKRL